MIRKTFLLIVTLSLIIGFKPTRVFSQSEKLTKASVTEKISSTSKISDQKSRFREVEKKLDKDGSLYLYLDIKDALRNLLKTIESMMATSAPKEAQKAVSIMNQVLDSLGLYGIDDIGISVINVGEYNRIKAYIRIPGDKKGIFKIIGETPHSFDTLDYAPPDAVVFCSADLYCEEALSIIRRTLQNTGGETAVSKFNSGLAKMNADLKINVENVIKSLDNRFTIIMSLDSVNLLSFPQIQNTTITMPSPKFAILVRVKDATLYTAFETILKEKGVTLTDETKENIKKTSIKLEPNKVYRWSPLFAFDGKNFIFASHSEYFDLILNTKKSGSNLSKQEEFKKLTKDLPTSGNSFIFVSAKFTEEVNNLTQKFVDIGNRERGELAAPFMMLSKMLENAGGMAAVRVPEPGGLWAVSNTPMSAIQVAIIASAAPSVPLLTAIAVPNFIEAQQRSKVSLTKADMRSLATALESYYVDCNDYPAWTTGADSANKWELPSFQVSTPQKKIMTLTTPIAYITSFLQDPFSKEGKTFSYYSVKNGWILWSLGPDQKVDLSLELIKKLYRADISQPSLDLLQYYYDPTNGSASGGDIVRIKQ